MRPIKLIQKIIKIDLDLSEKLKSDGSSYAASAQLLGKKLYSALAILIIDKINLYIKIRNAKF